MANLTNRQRNLLRLANQMSRNLINGTNTGDDNTSLNSNASIDFPGVDVDAGFNLDVDFGGDTDTPSTPPDTPTTLREVLLDLVNEQVEVTTPFGPVTGTLIAVRENYIVLVQADGTQVLVRIEKIELVSEL
ncbi:hypothetical protein GCM10009001_21570 [Virgibacillus siamensis]|uniref:DUF2642 domain-containing protein n=1 Tax=Virgibacillus siamensis TaxID=480071 RepID=A0ABN1G4Q0_9BACI